MSRALWGRDVAVNVLGGQVAERNAAVQCGPYGTVYVYVTVR